MVGAFVYPERTLKRIPQIIVGGAVSSSVTLDLVGFSGAFGWILTSERIPKAIASSALSITDNKLLGLLIVNLLWLFVGMVAKTSAH